ncbi:hypothetical protein GCM10027414_36580 [Humibacter ginsengiterrae]
MTISSESLAVLFDAYWIVSGPPSGRNVLTSLVAAWADTFPDDRITLAIPHSNHEFESFVEQFSRIDVIKVPRPRGMVHGLWVALRLGTRARDYDVLITQNFTPLLPSGRHHAALVTFVHDVLFVEHPEWFTWKERLYLQIASVGAGRADTILTSSLSERKRIMRVWRHTGDKVRAIGLAPPWSLVRASPSRPLNLAPHGAGRKFLLAVGRINIRKNLARLIEAYTDSEKLRSEYDLVIAGEADGRKSGIDPQAIPATVKFLGAVSDDELVWLYQNCRLFVFPSLDEGFGLPLVEAKHWGAEVAASNIEVFRELGCVDYYFDPRSVDDMREILELGLDEVAVRSGSQVASSFTWPAIAARARARVIEGNR